MAQHVHKDMSDALDAREIAIDNSYCGSHVVVKYLAQISDIVCHFINLILSVVFVQES